MNTEIKSAEEILKYIVPKDCIWEGMNNLTNVPIKFIIQAMEKYASQQSSVWIKASERLPELNQLVVYIRDTGDQFIYEAGFWSKEDLKYLKMNNITHWMPLPPALNDDEQSIKEIKGAEEILHPDSEQLLKVCFEELRLKLIKNQKKYGWSNEWLIQNWEEECCEQLVEHLKKGDPKDVAIYAMFMIYRGWSTKFKQLEKEVQSNVWVRASDELIEFINSLSENCGNKKKQEWYSGLISDIKIAYEQPIKEVPVSEDNSTDFLNYFPSAIYLKGADFEALKKEFVIMRDSFKVLPVSEENKICGQTCGCKSAEECKFPIDNSEDISNVSEDVDKAAENYASYLFHNKSSFEYHNQYKSFIDGAEWQKKQPDKIGKAMEWCDEQIKESFCRDNPVATTLKEYPYVEMKQYLKSLK